MTWQNDLCGRILANLLRKANRGGQEPVKIQLKDASSSPSQRPSTLPDPDLYIVIVSYSIKKSL